MIKINPLVLIMVWAVLGLTILLIHAVPSVLLGIIVFLIIGAGISYFAISFQKKRYLPKTQLSQLLVTLSGNSDEKHLLDLDDETINNLQILYDDNARRIVSKAVTSEEAERPDMVRREAIWEGIQLALDRDIPSADRILGPGVADKINRKVDSIIESEQLQWNQPKSSMDSEFSQLDMLSGSLENCVQSMYISSRNAAKANRIAFEARDFAAQNKDIVDQLVDTITSISQHSEKIKHIAESINSIAVKTNMLSLNASIEAARAGDAGKGFNVVAMEVKELAADAKKDANQTQSLINQILIQIESADQQVQRSVEAFSSLVEKSHQTGKLIEKMQESSLSGSHDMDRVQIGLIQSSVSIKDKWENAQKPSHSKNPAPELLLPKTYKLQTQWYPQAQFAGFYVALENGYYKEAGLNVEIVDGGPETNPIFSLIRGEFNFITAWLSSTITMLNRGAEIALLSQIFQKSGLTLVSLKQSGIRSIRDLKQKTISSWGGIFEYPIQAMNLDHELDMEILDYGDDMSKVRSGDIDVIAVMSYNELLGIYDSGVAEDDISLIRMSDVGYNFPEDGLYTAQSLLSNDESVCRQFSKASVRGWATASKDKDMALECTMVHHQRSPLTTSRNFQKKMLDEVCRLIDSSDGRLGYLRKDGFDQTQRALKRFGMIQNTADISKFYAGLNGTK